MVSTPEPPATTTPPARRATPSRAQSGCSSSSGVAFLDRERIVAALEEAARKLVASGTAEEVRLIGSLARGRATARSDADLLVVVRDSNRPQHLRSAAIAVQLGPLPLPVDILVRTRQEIAAALAAADRFWTKALEESIVLNEL